jgi:predicted RNase H-like HicB family nuclease
MITAYIRAAMEIAEFEQMENGRYFAAIPACQGFWAEGATIEECKAAMPEIFESWLLVALQHNYSLPVIAGIDLNPQPVLNAEAY